MRTPLQIAISYIGVTETPQNRGPQIRRFWADTDYPEGEANRQPWCAAFICHCFAQADREGWPHKSKKLPRDAGVKYFLAWAQGRSGIEVFTPNSQPLKPGDVVIFLPKLSHIGILEKVEGRILHTIEGNTDDSGGREGIKVCRRERALSFPGWIVRFL